MSENDVQAYCMIIILKMKKTKREMKQDSLTACVRACVRACLPADVLTCLLIVVVQELTQEVSGCEVVLEADDLAAESDLLVQPRQD